MISLRTWRSNVIFPQIIFFDFDGVLVESVEIKNHAFRKLYAEHGENVVEKVLAHHMEHGGISRVVKIRHSHLAFLGIDLTDEGLSTLAAQFAEAVEELVSACPAVKGAIEMLTALRAGRPLYIVSGTPECELKRIVARRGMTSYFHGVFGSPRRKEEIIEAILARHGVAPSDTLFVGDGMTDYWAARNSEVPFVGRVAPSWPNPFPFGTAVIADMTELLAFPDIEQPLRRPKEAKSEKIKANKA